MPKELPIKWEELAQEEIDKVKKFFPTWPLNDFVKYPGPVLMPRTFIPIADRLYNFELRPSDIWIVTYPKVGTTWSQEMIWQLVNDVDIEGGKRMMEDRSPFIEMGCITAGRDMATMKLSPDVPGNEKNMEKLKEFTNENDMLSYTDTLTGRRVIKCHLPMEFLPPKLLDTCKVVYVCRNVKDACVSYFNHNVGITPHDFQGDFNDFASLFKESLVFYGSYWHHLLGGWKHRNHENLKFIWFEEMKRDQKKVIVDLCNFLDHSLPEEKIDQLVRHLHVDNMKKNPSVKLPAHMTNKGFSFIRKGGVGDSKNYFNEEKAKEWNKWIEENTRGTGIQMAV